MEETEVLREDEGDRGEMRAGRIETGSRCGAACVREMRLG